MDVDGDEVNRINVGQAWNGSSETCLRYACESTARFMQIRRLTIKNARDESLSLTVRCSPFIGPAGCCLGRYGTAYRITQRARTRT